MSIFHKTSISNIINKYIILGLNTEDTTDEKLIKRVEEYKRQLLHDEAKQRRKEINNNLHQGLNAIEKMVKEYRRQKFFKDSDKINYNKIKKKIKVELEVLDTLPKEDKECVEDDIKILTDLLDERNLDKFIGEIEDKNRKEIEGRVESLSSSIKTYFPERKRKDLNGNIIR